MPELNNAIRNTTARTTLNGAERIPIVNGGSDAQHVTPTILLGAIPDRIDALEAGGVGGGTSALTANPVTAAYTFTGSPHNLLTTVNSSTNVILTVPTEATSGFSPLLGAVVPIVRTGTGEVTVTGASGVTIVTPYGARLAEVGSEAALKYLGSDTWSLSGDLGHYYADAEVVAAFGGTPMFKNGSGDSTPGLKFIFERARLTGATGWKIPAGVYQIKTTCSPVLTETLNVDATDAIFQITADGEGFEFWPGDTTGDIGFYWHGGKTDAKNQRVPSSVPYGSSYTAPQGVATAASPDAMSLQHRIQSDGSGGFEVIGTFGHINITGITCTGAEDHWEFAGGDSAIYISSCTSALISGCTFRGIRDACIYLSESQSRTGSVFPFVQDIDVIGNTFENSAVGVAMKRGGRRLLVTGNTFRNMIYGTSVNFLDGHPLPSSGYVGEEVTITNNSYHEMWRAILIEQSNNVVISGNTLQDFGMDVLDKTKPPTTISSSKQEHRAIEIQNSASYTIGENDIGGLTADYVTGGWTFAAETIVADAAPALGTATTGGGTSTSSITATFNDAPTGGETILALACSSARTFTGTGVSSASASGSINSGRLTYYRYPPGTTSVTFDATEGAAFLTWIAVPVPATAVEFAETSLGPNDTSNIEVNGLTPSDGTVATDDIALWFVATHDSETFTEPADAVLVNDGHNASIMLVSDNPAAGSAVPARTFSRTGTSTSQEMALTVLVSAS